MFSDGRLLIGKGEKEVYLEPKMANRHGLIAGATGTGKTITLKVMAESFSDMGVPVFLADIKGDLGGCVKKGVENENITKRLDSMGISRDEFIFTGYPVRFWDVFGEGGHPVRTTVSEMGSTLLSRLLGLTDVQSGVMDIVFRVADDKGWLLIDYKDLRAMVSYVAEHSKELLNDYGNVTKQSVGAIQRSLLRLEDEGAEAFFGEPSIDISDWIQTNEKGQGYINILHCVRLYHSPLLYSTFMLWLLSELFETLPEVGDLEKPKLVFFFDEAHTLFRDAYRPCRQDRAGDKAHTLKGRWRVLHNPVPFRRAGYGPCTAQQQGAACAQGIYSLRAACGKSCGADIPAKSCIQHGNGHNRACDRAGAGKLS